MKEKFKDVFLSFDCKPQDKVVISLNKSKDDWENVRNEITQSLLVTKTYNIAQGKSVKDGEDRDLLDKFRNSHKQLFKNL